MLIKNKVSRKLPIILTYQEQPYLDVSQNHSGVNPLTRAQVFAEAKRLGYDYFEQRTEKDKSKNDRRYHLQIAKNLSEDHELSPGFTLMPGISEFALIDILYGYRDIISKIRSRQSRIS